jgi:hypothetical protein
VVTAFISYYSGRRALPLWSAVAEAPGRLATWALSGIQGATAAPLGGGATSLGAAFLVGATLAGSPAMGEAPRSVRASADVAPAAASGGPARDGRAPRDVNVAAGPGASEALGDEGEAPRRQSNGDRGRGERLLKGGVTGEAPAGEQAADESQGGTETAAGGSGGGETGGGDRGLELPDVATRPADTTKADTGDRDDDADRPIRVTDTPKVDLSGDDVPKLDQPRVELPDVKVEVPKVELPKVSVPGVEVPRVELPPVEVQVELPPVEVPKVLPLP